MRRLAAALLAALAGLALASGLGAQSGVDVRANSAQSDFPNGIVFNLTVAADAGFDEIELVYHIAPDGVRATAVPQCSGDAVTSCSFELAASQRNVLIPGAEVTYFWRVTSGGATQETEPQVVTYEDDRFAFRSVGDDGVTVWYYAGSEDGARAILQAARDSLDRIGALLQTTIDFPVKVFYYASAADLQQAILADNTEGVVTLGEVVYSDTAMVSADAAPEDITRHEVAHIVVRQAVGEPFGVPDWLNEGLAVYAQSQPLSNQRDALEAAIERDSVFSVRSLSSASTGAAGDTVSLFYGQSWSLVSFLIERYGEAEFADLFRAFDDGANTGDALQRVYGFDQDGLENAWRESVGLPPRAAPTPSDLVAPTAPRSVSPSTANDGDGAPVGLIVVIVVVTAVVAGGLLGAGVYLARRL